MNKEIDMPDIPEDSILEYIKWCKCGMNKRAVGDILCEDCRTALNTMAKSTWID